MSHLPRVGIIDYQMGNLRSVSKGIERAGGIPIVGDSYGDFRDATHLILPGVGAFRDAIEQLRRHDWVGFIQDWVESDRRFLGICLGLQLLLDVSFEGGEYQGLGIVKGKVVKFEFEDPSFKVPHMGWNQVASRFGAEDPILCGLGPAPYFYFVHSYHAVLERPGECWMTSNYGHEFCAAIQRGNLLATQFHPEKSQSNGIGLLRNFLNQFPNQSPTQTNPSRASATS
jgi:glutamine amidotransferase